MSSPKRKFYVVWQGRAPGIYDSWEECQEQIKGFPEAKYKAFPTQDMATKAFRGDPKEHMGFLKQLGKHIGSQIDYTTIPEIQLNAIAVDGACAKNPGPMEYRCVRVVDGVEVFRKGPFSGGTNNIGEYLALIHAAALLEQRGDRSTPIYSDSKTALAWVRNRRSNTKIVATTENAEVMAMLERADRWIASHTIQNPILKWNTEEWGEIPADFGRK